MAVTVFKACGTTSAYAENTGEKFQEYASSGNYLRVRGEYHGLLTLVAGQVELPPRTRRIP